ncbi:MAG: hypothetical protein ACOYCB_11995 [Fastidiosipilaceae bacterium]
MVHLLADAVDHHAGQGAQDGRGPGDGARCRGVVGDAEEGDDLRDAGHDVVVGGPVGTDRSVRVVQGGDVGRVVGARHDLQHDAEIAARAVPAREGVVIVGRDPVGIDEPDEERRQDDDEQGKQEPVLSEPPFGTGLPGGLLGCPRIFRGDGFSFSE